MRGWWLWFFVFALLATTLSAQTVVGPPIPPRRPSGGGGWPPKTPVTSPTWLGGPSGYWTMDEASGNVRLDTFGFYNLSEIGTVSTIAGVNNLAASFSGANALRSAQSPPLTSAFTISIRYKVPAGDLALLTSNGQLQILILQHRFYAEVTWSGGARASWPGLVVDDNVWHHSIVWVDPATDLKVHSTTDGGVDTLSFNPVSGNPGTKNTPLVIGDAGTGLAASIDEVYWYGQAMTPAQRAEIATRYTPF
jgi:hypothetical protein